MGKCENSIVIDQPVDKVWQAISDFHDMSWAKGVIEECKKVGDKGGSEVGAQRELNGVFHETLLSVDDAATTFTYQITDGPGPIAKDAVTNYVGKVVLRREGEGTLVEWTSTYEQCDDAAVAELCNPIYVALLNAMKANVA
jgi:carbon monoxide dehydrogenase subunit G